VILSFSLGAFAQFAHSRFRLASGDKHMQRVRRDQWVAAVAVGLLGIAACSSVTASGPAAGSAPPPEVLALEEEALLGANLDSIINSETKPAPTALQDHFQSLLDQLAQTAGGDREGMLLSVKVLDSPEIANVFATPSGSIYVTSGVLLASADEAEVAAVLAHELGHVVKRHPIARLVRGFGFAQVKALAVSQSRIARDQGLSSALTAATYALLTGGAQLRYLPEEETAADTRALAYLDHEGFDKGALVSFLGGGGSKSHIEALTILHAAHPLSLERLAMLPSRQSHKRPRPTTALAALKDQVAEQKAENKRLGAKKAQGKSSADPTGLEKASARR
jgi:predicted Zn-dependent protease